MTISDASRNSSVESSQDACNVCNGSDNLRMVQCDKCDNRLYFDCVGVSQEVENQDWLCSDCHEKQLARNKESTKSVPSPTPPVRHIKELPKPPQSNLPPRTRKQVLEENLTQHFKASSLRFTKQKQLKVRLQILEEERKQQEAEEARRRECISNRHQLLKELAEEEEEDEIETELENDRVSQWLNETAVNDDVVPQVSNLLQPSESVTASHVTSVVESVERMQVSDQFSFRSCGTKQSGVYQRQPDKHSKFIPNQRSTPNQDTFGTNNGNGMKLTQNQVEARQAVSREFPIFSGSP
ncbi:uncharacterized protein LOC131428965 [Malaya genurostris]|uniref:uncharacterized protein LOC131428965 n=1 Tax=Malaya genurostris TaxID=325434 RepID=UPI0026F3D936|nr:uncharacterized protein LOC131428965 [Malaya genurostris]